MTAETTAGTAVIATIAAEGMIATTADTAAETADMTGSAVRREKNSHFGRCD